MKNGNRKELKSKNKLADYLFWFLFFVYTNPGAIIETVFKEDRGDGGINIVDFIFAMLCVCYAFIHFSNDHFDHKMFNKFFLYFVIFDIYIFLIFGYLVPAFMDMNVPFKFVFIKSRTTIYNLLLFLMTYRFLLRNNKIFIRLFLFSSLIVMILFIFSVISGIEILPVATVDRRFININRIFLKEYGLMPYLIPLSFVLLIFKIKIKGQYIILMAGGLMFLVWLLSLTRRHIFGTMIYLFIALILFNYFNHKKLVPIKKLLSVFIFSMILLGFIYMVFPKYIEGGIMSIQETFYVLTHGENSIGMKDERLGFNRKFIVDIFLENPLFGTGFDNRWRTGSGGRDGYEAADYPFLSALAMTGLSGILIFIPIYYLLIKTILFDIRLLRKSFFKYDSIEYLLFMTSIVFFVFTLMQYMNWFLPISVQASFDFYIYLAIYLASREWVLSRNKINGLGASNLN